MLYLRGNTTALLSNRISTDNDNNIHTEKVKFVRLNIDYSYLQITFTVKSFNFVRHFLLHWVYDPTINIIYKLPVLG